MSTEKDLMDKAKEAVIISSFATLSIFLMKKLTGKPAKDPSSSLEGYLMMSVDILVALYLAEWLKKQKILPV